MPLNSCLWGYLVVRLIRRVHQLIGKEHKTNEVPAAKTFAGSFTGSTILQTRTGRKTLVEKSIWELLVNESIDLHFSYTADEYVRALRRHYRTSLDIRRDVIGGLIGITGGLCLVYVFRETQWLGWVTFSVGTLLLVMVGYATFICRE